jgi:hypothetical protein
MPTEKMPHGDSGPPAGVVIDVELRVDLDDVEPGDRRE